MSKSLSRHASVAGGVAGAAFQSNARQGSQEEAALIEIQYKLAGTHTPEASQAHLFLVTAKQTDGPNITLVGLWVPHQQFEAAVQLLTTAGFDVLDA